MQTRVEEATDSKLLIAKGTVGVLQILDLTASEDPKATLLHDLSAAQQGYLTMP